MWLGWTVWKTKLMAKNYYLILGVGASASSDEIKAAFRRRARELHPDTSGMESGPFLEVQEAYTVLSDPEQRREYDRQALSRARRRPWEPSAEPLVPPARLRNLSVRQSRLPAFIPSGLPVSS